MRACILAALAVLSAPPASADPTVLPGLYSADLPSGVSVEILIGSRSPEGVLQASWRLDSGDWHGLTGALGEGEEFTLDEGGERVVHAEPAEEAGTFRAQVAAWPGRRGSAGQPPDITADLAALDSEDPAERDRAERSLARTALERQVREALEKETSLEARARLKRLLTCEVMLVRVATFHHAEWNSGDQRFSAACRTLRLPRAEPGLRAWAASVEKQSLDRVQAEWLAFQDDEEGPESEESDRGYYEEEWSVELLRHDLVSLRAIVSIDGGGVHPNYVYETATARLCGGDVKDVALADWFRADSGWQPALCALVFDALKDDEAGWIVDGQVSELSADDLQVWTAARDGLHFIFPPYAMGCYAEGTHEVVLPWARLDALLDPEGPASGLHR